MTRRIEITVPSDLSDTSFEDALLKLEVPIPKITIRVHPTEYFTAKRLQAAYLIPNSEVEMDFGLTPHEWVIRYWDIEYHSPGA